VQIIQPFKSSDIELGENEIAAKIQNLLQRGELNGGISGDDLPVAIAICDISALPYAKLQAWARALVSAHEKRRSRQPLIVLSQQDIGLALGQTIKIHAPEIDLVILDGVDTSLGDFIDIGSTLANKKAVPLTVKSLIFNS
jgi:ethanolamine utilization protein EutA